MNEHLIDMECGFYDEFHQMLYNKELDMDDIETLYGEERLTEKQYKYAKEYLKGE